MHAGFVALAYSALSPRYWRNLAIQHDLSVYTVGSVVRVLLRDTIITMWIRVYIENISTLVRRATPLPGVCRAC